MKVILRQDVEHVGFAEDIVTVKNGYARNFLIPKGFAILATPSALKVREENLKQRAFKERKIVEEAKELEAKLVALDLKIPAKAGAADKLFGSITAANLAEILEKEGITIDRKYITIAVAGGAIKRLGQYDATIRFHREVVSTLTFDVIAEA
ncbi:MAG TPA: 50S ribosomal protein L9 [Flavobacteriaceae bacterium]|nr:50S ribosomal protein L9 [Flavobacteriaceae bacterium]